MIIDISQEIFSCKVFPGDPAPAMERVKTIGEKGSVANLTAFSMCAHNGTHVDTPLHFLPDGAPLDQVGLEPFVGQCYVARHEGDVLAADADAIMARARAAGAAERMAPPLRFTASKAAAAAMARRGVFLPILSFVISARIWAAL